MIPVILSGGSGTRLWPVSRKSHPKQFWPLISQNSLLYDTCARLREFPGIEAPVVVCNADHRFFVAEQLQSVPIGKPAIILEPVGRNTAPAVATAALHAQSISQQDPILLVLPADHVIRDIQVFRQAVEVGERLAESGSLVTFGIVPTYPETGYGYIQGGVVIHEESAAKCIVNFVEKPDRDTAQNYLDAGNFYWNSGMFMFKASSYLNVLHQHAPEIYQAVVSAYGKAKRDLDFIRLDEKFFNSSPSDSIDYAVMEKIDNGVVIPLNAGWSDIGSWSALWEIGAKDARGNVVQGDAVLKETHNCLVRAGSRLVATLGVEDQIIVETPDVVLVAHRNHVQNVKEIVSALIARGRDEAVDHHCVQRPWGKYREIDRSDRYQVKRITVKPGASLSLQMHHHRAEHWIVVSGTARVTRGKESFFVAENQSTYIPLGEPHRLENPGRIPLELVEVQSGSYLGEDDIVRLNDVYGREEI